MNNMWFDGPPPISDAVVGRGAADMNKLPPAEPVDRVAVVSRGEVVMVDNTEIDDPEKLPGFLKPNAEPPSAPNLDDLLTPPGATGTPKSSAPDADEIMERQRMVDGYKKDDPLTDFLNEKRPDPFDGLGNETGHAPRSIR